MPYRGSLSTTKPRPGGALNPSHPLARGLVLWWMFNEGSGSKAYDVSGYGNHGTLTNMDPATDWVGSKSGGGLDHDGTNDFVTAVDSVSLDLTTKATVSIFFRQPAAAAFIGVGKLAGFTSGESYSLYRYTDNKYYFQVSGNGSVAALRASNVAYTDTGWHHLVGTYDGDSTTLRVYLDGVEIATTPTGTVPASLFNSASAFQTRAGTSNHSTGIIEDVRVWNRVLAPGEVRQLTTAQYSSIISRYFTFIDRVHGSLEIEGELGGPGLGWSNLTPLRYPVEIRYGIAGGGPLDLVAGAGTLTFSLSNGRNGGNPLGYYSPGHVACRAGFRIGTHVRCRWMKSGGTLRYKFYGWLEVIDPTAGEHRGLISQCVALDWMNAAADHDVNVATQVNKRYDEVVTTLIAAVPRQPEGMNLAPGVSTFPYVLSESQTVLTMFQSLAESEYGRIYEKGDGVVYGENRTARLTPSVVAMFDDDGVGGMADLSAPHDRSRLVNRVKGTIHPRRVDAAATTILFTLQQASPISQHSVAAGATVTIDGDFNDPTTPAAKVGGTDMVVPVATTDYTMFANADGTGTNLTASFTVIAAYSGDGVLYTITNTSGTAGYITKLQARGRGLYDYDPIDVWVSDQTSIDNYGEASIEIDMAYLSDVPTADSIGAYIRDTWKSPGAIEVVLRVHGGNDDDIDAIMAREPGDVITVNETATGVSSVYFINFVDLRIDGRYDVNAEFVLQRAPIGAGSYFTLDSATLGQLDQDVLAPL